MKTPRRLSPKGLRAQRLKDLSPSVHEALTIRPEKCQQIHASLILFACGKVKDEGTILAAQALQRKTIRYQPRRAKELDFQQGFAQTFKSR